MDCDSVLSAVAGLLKGEFPQATVYLNAMDQGATLPCFFLLCPRMEAAGRLFDVREVERLYQVVYLPDDDSPNPTEENQQVLLTLLRHLGELETDEGKHRTRDLQGSADNEGCQVQFTVRHREVDRDSGVLINEETTKGVVR